MIEFLGLALICCGAVIAIAAAVNFFWAIGWQKSLGIGALFACAFLIFWAGGFWANQTRYSWGSLTPLFALILGAAWFAVKLGLWLRKQITDKLNDKLNKND